MIAAVSATIVAVAKKVLAMLLGDEKGRKFLLYVVCMALVIVLLPLIAAIALFGSMSGGVSVDYDMVYDNLPTEQRELLEQYDDELDMIADVFGENGLSRTEISQAQTIYISCLVGKESEDGFYQTYADCFLNQTEDSDLLDNISSAFGVTFSEREREQFENLYS